MNMSRMTIAGFAACVLLSICLARAGQIQVTDGQYEIKIATGQIEASIRKSGYVSGIAEGSFLDIKTGFRDPGFGLDIVDWLMESGSDQAYRDALDRELVYEFNNSYHGKTPKRSIEGPQICTRAKSLQPKVTMGKDFVAVTMDYTYNIAAPGKNIGSVWRQTVVFPEGARYFISCDKITTANSSDSLFLRLDMPGHVRHHEGDTFTEVYLSYCGSIPASEFFHDFAPDEKFNYTRGRDPLPQRFIRAYRLRDPKTGKPGPWLAGMTLRPDVVSEAWCHQREYICMIQEFGGYPIRRGESFSAAFLVGYFDSIEEMNDTYDRYAGYTGLEISQDSWKLSK